MNIKNNLVYPVESILYNVLFRCFLWRKPKYQKRYRISICGIFKNEARFLKEWIEYHLMIGVDHFYMYDNNSEDAYLDVLQPYIERGTVTLIDWPYQQKQIEAYQDCFERFRQETQWLSFTDIDEFFVPHFHENMNDWIKGYERYPSILVYWKMFGTSAKMKHDFSQLVMEQYTICHERFGKQWGKCIINTDYDIAYYNQMTHHYCCVKYPVAGIKVRAVPVNVFKRFVVGSVQWKCLDRFHKRSIQLNHYWSKAWDLYEEKRQRTDVYHLVNPKKDLRYFYDEECLNVSSDFTIFRFIMKLKIRLGGIV